MSVLHVPWEVHSVAAIPFRSNPSSQVDEQRAPKLNSPCGAEQAKEPWPGEFRGGHLLAERYTRRRKRRRRNQYFHELRTGTFSEQYNFKVLYWLRLMDKTSIIVLPKHWGMSELHVPTEVHSATAVPFKKKPVSHVMLHWEPKLNSSWGWEQTREPWKGLFRSGHFLTAEGINRGTFF